MNDILLETLPAAPPGDIPSGDAFPSPRELAEREAAFDRKGFEDSAPATPEEQRRTEKPAARQFIEEKLAIELVLSIRGGAWHPLHEVCGALDSFIPAPLAERRFQTSNEVEGVPDVRLARGKALLLAGAVEYLQNRKLVELRTSETGEETIRSTPLVDPRFRLDPEFEAELPKSAEEVRALEALLLVEDCHTPLLLWQSPDGNLLVDGYTRYLFLSLIGKPYAIIWQEFTDRAAVLDYIVKVHEGRRSLSAYAKAYYSGRRYNRDKQSHGGSRGKNNSSGHFVHLKRTSEVIAKQDDVDGKTIRRHGKYAAALDKVAKVCGIRIRQGVLSRELNWTFGDVETLAHLPAAEQKRIVEEALKSNKRPALAKYRAKKKGETICVRLSATDPLAQRKALELKLGPAGFARLQAALNQASANGDDVYTTRGQE